MKGDTRSLDYGSRDGIFKRGPYDAGSDAGHAAQVSVHKT